MTAAPGANPWAGLVQAATRRAPHFRFRADGIGVDGESFWLGARRWADAYVTAGLRSGDRLVVADAAGPASASAIVAALVAGLTVVPSAPTAEAALLAEAVDPAAAVVGPDGLHGHPVPWAWTTGGAPGPASVPSALRPTRLPPTPEARLLVPGGAAGTVVALGDQNVLGTVGAVLEALAPTDGRWLSALPWFRADGILLDLLPAVLGTQDVVRVRAADPSGASSDDEIVAALGAERPAHVVLELRTVRHAVATFGGPGPLAELDSGLATGPGLDEALAVALRPTRLRSSRGAAEVSALATMGEPGLWRVGSVGRAVGCTIENGPGGTVLQGTNAALGTWGPGGLTVADPHRLVALNFEP